jgi:hypothetical protein
LRFHTFTPPLIPLISSRLFAATETNRNARAKMNRNQLDQVNSVLMQIVEGAIESDSAGESPPVSVDLPRILARHGKAKRDVHGQKLAASPTTCPDSETLYRVWDDPNRQLVGGDSKSESVGQRALGDTHVRRAYLAVMACDRRGLLLAR